MTPTVTDSIDWTWSSRVSRPVKVPSPNLPLVVQQFEVDTTTAQAGDLRRVDGILGLFNGTFRQVHSANPSADFQF
jgi:hypothetical protein